MMTPERNKEGMLFPEYGRNIQKMVDIACTIDSFPEKQRCVNTIINSLYCLCPYLRNDEFKFKIWDNLLLMSNFKLLDCCPFQIPEGGIQHMQDTKPQKITRFTSDIVMPHYGRYVQDMIDRVSRDEQLAQRMDVIMIIANYMKQCYATYNQEIADDNVIFNHLYDLSEGRLNYCNLGIRLAFVQLPSRNNNNRKYNNHNNRR